MRAPARIAIALLAAACLHAQSAEEPSEWSLSFETSAASRYLWRGFVLNDSPSLQPGVTVGYKGFSFTTWHNFSRDVPHGQAWTEHDVSAEYSREIGKLTVSAGVARFMFPDLSTEEGNASTEVSFGLSYSHWLEPSFKLFRDLGDGDGYYYLGSVGHTFALPRKVGLNTSVGVGLNQHLYEPQTTISDVTANVSVDFPVGEAAVISPFFTQAVGNRTLFGRRNVFGVKLVVER